MNSFVLVALTSLLFYSWNLEGLALANKNDAQNTKAETKPLGPHGGNIVSANGGKFEVTVDEEKHLLDVYTLSPPSSSSSNPKRVRVGGKNNPQEIHLRAVNPWRGLPHFQGSYNSPSIPGPAGGPQKGIEIEFGLSP